MTSKSKTVFEGIAHVADFSKDKTWLFIPQTKSEIEVDEGLGLDHDEFVKIQKEELKTNLYCVIKELAGKRYFERAYVTNMDNVSEIKSTLAQPGSKESKIGRNEPCTCGSHKKYKKCCGSIMQN